MYLELDNLVFRYGKTAACILDGFNLTVQKSEIVSLVGMSGSGKSTVLRLIAGLEAPLKGAIRIGGRTVVDEATFLPPEKRNVGMVFQDYALFPHLTVGANIGFGLGALPAAQRAQRTSELLALINMQDYQDRYPHQLSGGQQQRVAVARALAPRPAILLMDEPFSNIDYELKKKIRRDIRAILNAENTTCIFVTHDHSDLADMADRSVYLPPTCA